MTLSRRLHEITCTNDPLKVKAFEEAIAKHPEKKLLTECLKSAQLGESFINFGRNICPPESLNLEGFHLEQDECFFKYCWD